MSEDELRRRLTESLLDVFDEDDFLCRDESSVDSSNSDSSELVVVCYK